MAIICTMKTAHRISRSVVLLLLLSSGLLRAQQAEPAASLSPEVTEAQKKYVAMVAELEGTHDCRLRALTQVSYWPA